MFKKIISLITIILFSTMLALGYTTSTNLSFRLPEATDNTYSVREDFVYNFGLVDDLFDDVSLTEFGYLDGVTSNIQDQLNAGGTAYTGDTEIVVTGTVLSIGSAITRDTELSSYYLKTAIDSETEMETIWGVGLAHSGANSDITSMTGLTTALAANYGGTGVANNAASTLTISGNYATTLTVTGATGVTLPTTGTLATTGDIPDENAIEAYIFDADAETITGNWDNTANPWADNEVSDTLTSSACTGTAAIATTVTITDNESEAENNPIVFVAGGDLDGGNLGLETDGTAYYTPSTGVITATGFAGALTGNVTGNADTVTGFTPASGSLTLAGADALTITTTAETGVTLPTSGTLLANVVEDTSPDLGGELDAGAHSIGFTQQTATGDGTTTIDWTLGNKFYFTFGNANETFTFTAPSNPCNIVLVLKQYSTGGKSATWPATVMWPGGTAPTLSTGNNDIDIVCFYWDGTNYFGNVSLDFSVPA
jgi:hypothetical protein